MKRSSAKRYDWSTLSDGDIVEALQDYKIAHNQRLFKSSPDLWEGLLKRAQEEKIELIELAAREELLARNGINIPVDLSNESVAHHVIALRHIDQQPGPNTDTEKLQEMLNALGYTDTRGHPLVVDGHYGPSTKHVVEIFQRDHGLSVDGSAGATTWAALHEATRTASIAPTIAPDAFATTTTEAAVVACRTDSTNGRTAFARKPSMKDYVPTYPNPDDDYRPEWEKKIRPLFSAAEDKDGEGARPSSLIPVHRPAVIDPLHEMNLLRMMQVANERTLRELGPLPPGGLPVQKKRKPTAPYTDFLGRLVPEEPINEENNEMKLRQMAATAVLTAAGALAACDINHDADAATPSSKPQSAAPNSASTSSFAQDDSAAPQASTSHASAQDSDTQVELKPFIEPGMRIRAVARGDINNDGLPDVVMVLETSADKEKARSMLLLVRDRAGVLHKAAQNDKVVPCASCGGMFGDPFSYVRIANGAVTVSIEGGSREHWWSEYVFKYSANSKRLMLHEVGQGVADTATDKNKEAHLTIRDFGSIAFENFDPSSLPKVAIP